LGKSKLLKKIVSGVMLAVLLLSVVVSLGVIVPTAIAGSDGWWNSSWRFRRNVTVENPNSFALIEYPTNVTLDTRSLVLAGKMNPDGSDLRLLRNSEEIDFAIIDFNTSNTKIVFKSSVPANGNNPNYTLYYGNPAASDVSVSYEKIKYELIDEFNDGVIDPMWNFSYGGYPGVELVPTHYESDGSLYIEKGPVANLAVAYTTGIKIHNSEVLHIQCRAYTGEIDWAGYNGMYNHLWNTEQARAHLFFGASTYDKSPNAAGPFLSFNTGTGKLLSTEIKASRIDWTQLNYQWYNYEVYWNESSNFARMTMNESYYDNENTNGYFEDYSFDELWLCAGAYAPSGTAYAKFDYIRVWQEVSKQPTTLLGAQESLGPVIDILYPKNETYTERNVPLIFTVSELPSWIGYSLDGQANVTIAGNTTLTSLVDGSHYVVVYANSTDGAMGVSNTVHFQVDATPPNITNVSQYPLENNVLPENEVKINATVTDVLNGVRKVTLIYAYTNSSGTWIRVIHMTNIGGNIWNATIPAFAYGTNVTYVIMAEDNVNNTITTEEMGYDYRYQVIPEFPSTIILPLFTLTTLIATVLLKKKRKTKPQLP
jgi:hypothetical protein